jgi:quercetin dioxygenase-like cupin family protein
MTVVQGNRLQYIDTPGGNAGVALATPSRGASEVSVIRQRQQPGGNNPAHTHDREEVIVVLAGSVTVTLNGDVVTLGPGDTIIVPPHVLHQLENAGSEPADWLLVAPAGVGFFHANGEQATPPWAR